MKLIGITGALGTGKTTALYCFQHIGAQTIESDDIVHELYTSNRALREQIHDRWGDDVFDSDGNIDRQSIASKIFRDSGEKQWLQALVYPLVWERIKTTAQRTSSPLFCAVPLLYEAGWHEYFEAVITVWCDTTTQRERLLQKGWNASEIERRTKHQGDLQDKLERADFGVINVGDLELLEQQCRRIMRNCGSVPHSIM